MELDNALRSLGIWGRHQIFVLIFFNVFCSIILGWITMSVVFFTAHSENYYCKPYTGFYPNETIPGMVDGDGEDEVDHCHIYGVNDGEVTWNKTKCKNGWYYEATVPGEATFITDLDLVCDHSILAEVAASLFMGGTLIGALPIGQIPDIIGRKPVFFVSLIVEVVVGVGLAFAWNYYAIVFLWVISGMVHDGVLNTGFILLFEKTVPEYRALVGSLLNTTWGISMASMAGIAYILPNWRHMQLFMSLCFLLALPFYKMVTESERWLIAKGRQEEAEDILQYVAKFNKVQKPPKYFLSDANENRESNKENDDMDTDDNDTHDKPHLKNGYSKLTTDIKEGSPDYGARDDVNQNKSTVLQTEGDVVQTKPKQNTFLDLFRTPALLKISLILFASHITNGGVYYGLSIHSANMSGNKYLNVFLIGLVEVPAYIVAYLSIEKFGRRMSMVVTLVVAGVACVMTACIPHKTESGINLYPLIIACAMTGKFMISYSFAVLFVYTPELMPTVVRNASQGMVCIATRFGGVLAPYAIHLGKYNKYLPLNIFGVICIATGFLSILLPETRNKPLPETLEDAVRMYGKNEKMKTSPKEENV